MIFKNHLKKIKPSYKATHKRIRFLYINRKILLKHRTFLHHFCHYLRGCSTEFDGEILKDVLFNKETLYHNEQTIAVKSIKHIFLNQ